MALSRWRGPKPSASGADTEPESIENQRKKKKSGFNEMMTHSSNFRSLISRMFKSD
jgi:hypothetical protein